MVKDNQRYYSVADLVAMNLPSFPASRQGVDVHVKREGWPHREVKGYGGPGGIKREYQPPPEVQALINMRLLAKSFDAYRSSVAAGEPLAKAEGMFLDDYNRGSSTVELVDGLVQICPEDLTGAIRMGPGLAVAEPAPADYAVKPQETGQNAHQDTITVQGETIMIGDKAVPWVRVTPPNLFQLIESTWAVRDALPDDATKDEIMLKTVQAFAVLTVIAGGDYGKVERAICNSGVLEEFLELCRKVRSVTEEPSDAS